ncbi:hypothetical protein ACFYWP_35715 [Actinacidiphila glaucinigra]|uniref:hypothetical protein n=1 Tax=Actinacidiphila glaucinigra TaxID=235986 RepID=UPI0036AEF8CD
MLNANRAAGGPGRCEMYIYAQMTEMVWITSGAITERWYHLSRVRDTFETTIGF